MKTNAIVRIVLYSVIALLLLGILVIGLMVDSYTFKTEAGSYQTNEASVVAGDVSGISIDWAAGSITIIAADTDQITFRESGEISEKYTMVYSLKNGELSIDYSRSSVSIGFGSIPSKDLTITVPKDWVCRELELDGAALEVNVDGLTVQDFDIDGAANEVTFTGSLGNLECDGASCELKLNCTTNPKKIELDGASVSLELYLPEDCGFLVQMDGLGCSFRSDLDYTGSNGDYMYGDRYCQVYVDGLSCSVTIQKGS